MTSHRIKWFILFPWGSFYHVACTDSLYEVWTFIKNGCYPLGAGVGVAIKPRTSSMLGKRSMHVVVMMEGRC